jgi:peptidoglycan/xylan/chitin deacetylase (PgdA/CDA1 family)
MKSKRRRKSKQPKSSGNISPWFTLAAIIFFLYTIANFGGIINYVGQGKPDAKYISGKILGNIRLTPPPATPTPTSVPTPTPVPLAGYCLNVPVLMYHHIQPNSLAKERGQGALSVDNGEFDLQMGYLVSSGYSVISAEQLVNALINHTGLPSKSIVITMDDGYSDIYAYAYPVLQKYHIVANLMIPTGLLGGQDYLTWSQVAEMVHSGLAYLGGHTWSHYSIAQGPTDKINFEITTGKQQLQDYTGQNVNVFTYPYGSFNNNAIAALRQNGIIGAFSEIPGHWQCDSFVMALHRTRIGNSPLSYYGL